MLHLTASTSRLMIKKFLLEIQQSLGQKIEKKSSGFFRKLWGAIPVGPKNLQCFAPDANA